MILTSNRSNKLPPDVEIEIIRRLHGASIQILCITACVIVGAWVMAARTGDVYLWSIMGAAVVTGGVRVVGVVAFQRRSSRTLTLSQARRWETLYAAAALAFALVISALTVRIFHVGYSEGYILAVGLAMGISSGACSRAARLWLCCAICTIAVGVLILALSATGDALLCSMAFLLGLYLLSTYEAAVRNVRQLEAVLVGERELEFAARRDALTGLANRRAFDEGMGRLSQTGKGLSLLLLDLDGFKAVNDRLGHAAGDDLLRQVAERLASVSGKEDVVARLGGDEFAIISNGMDAPAARRLAEAIVGRLCQPFRLQGATVTVGASVGIKTVGAEERWRNPEELLLAADEALYTAKRAGKGRAIFAKLRTVA